MLALSTTDLTTGLTPTDLVQALIGAGLTASNIQFSGDNRAAGLFVGGVSDGLGVESGVMLSSGNIANAVGPNNSENTSTSFGLPGDTQLDALIPGFTTNDAAILEFDFVAIGGTLTFDYVFGSEEYNEFVGSSFNDVFAFFLDGVNIALIPGTTTPVSINNLNNESHSEFYNDNSLADFGSPTPFGTEADGFTVLLQATATITPGTHHIKLAIADAGDTALDSWVFLAANSFVSGDADLEITITDSPDPVVVNNPLTYTLAATNHGPDPATRVVVQDTLPAGVTFLGATTSQGTIVESGGIVIAEVGTLASGATATITIKVIPHALGTITNTAAIEAPQMETNPDNNVASQDTSVEPARLFINDVQVVEGNTGTKNAVFTVSLNAPDINATISVGYQTINATAGGGTDYLPVSGAITFAPGIPSRAITVPIVGDTRNEATETFLVQLVNAVNAELVKSLGIGTILDNDPLPYFYVSDVQVTSTTAGLDAAVFTVALDSPSGREVSVEFATADGTAVDSVDYVGQSGLLTFPPGVTTRLVSVPVFTSDVYVPNKQFFLNLSVPINALTADPQGTATIVFAQGPVAEFIVDNGNLGYSETAGWTNLTNTLAYQLDYAYAPAAGGSAAATWTFDNIPHESYQVFARWIPFGNRATNAPFTILDGATPVGTVLVNQQVAPAGDQSNAISWQSLGTFTSNTGKLVVRLTNNANGYVVADAVRIVTNGIAPQTSEMDVAGFERSIGTGDVTPALEDATDFGQVASITGSATHTFAIRNHGNADLHLTRNPRVTIGGPHAADFSIVAQPEALIAPGKKTTFQLVFLPLATGIRSAVISIANDDDSEHPYTFVVRGTGTDAGDVPPPAPVVHNAALPQDVNDDGRVSPFDLLLVINHMTAQSVAPSAAPLTDTASPAATAATHYLDVNDDRRVSPLDALLVINYLLQAPAAPSAAPQTASSGGPPALAAVAVDEAIARSEVSLDEPAANPRPGNEPGLASEAVAAGKSAAVLLLEPVGIGLLLGSDESDELASDDAFDPLLVALGIA